MSEPIEIKEYNDLENLLARRKVLSRLWRIYSRSGDNLATNQGIVALSATPSGSNKTTLELIVAMLNCALNFWTELADNGLANAATTLDVAETTWTATKDVFSYFYPAKGFLDGYRRKIASGIDTEYDWTGTSATGSEDQLRLLGYFRGLTSLRIPKVSQITASTNVEISRMAKIIAMDAMLVDALMYVGNIIQSDMALIAMGANGEYIPENMLDLVPEKTIIGPNISDYIRRRSATTLQAGYSFISPFDFTDLPLLTNIRDRFKKKFDFPQQSLERSRTDFGLYSGTLGGALKTDGLKLCLFGSEAFNRTTPKAGYQLELALTILNLFCAGQTNIFEKRKMALDQSHWTWRGLEKTIKESYATSVTLKSWSGYADPQTMESAEEYFTNNATITYATGYCTGANPLRPTDWLVNNILNVAEDEVTTFYATGKEWTLKDIADQIRHEVYYMGGANDDNHWRFDMQKGFEVYRPRADKTVTFNVPTAGELFGGLVFYNKASAAGSWYSLREIDITAPGLTQVKVDANLPVLPNPRILETPVRQWLSRLTLAKYIMGDIYGVSKAVAPEIKSENTNENTNGSEEGDKP